MFNRISTYIIIALSFVVIVFIMRNCADTGEENEVEFKKAYDSAISELKGRMARVNELQEHAIKSIAERRAKDSIVIKAKDERIAALVKQAARQRTPKVDTLILDNPDLKSFVDTQTEIIQEQRVQIDTLKSVIAFQRKLNEDLINAEFVEDKIEADMAIQNTRRIAELEKQSRKKERRSKLKGILVPVALIGGLLFGASL